MNENGSCGIPGSEQLYMLEIIVERLNLTSDMMNKVGRSSLCVRLKLENFPVFEVSQDEFVSGRMKRGTRVAVTPDGKPATNGSVVDFSAGKSCLFTKQPRDLVRGMRSNPLEVRVYKVSDKSPCETSEDKPICKTRVPLSGCLCDIASMARNDTTNLPNPYTLGNTYNLIDDEGRPAGTIAIIVKLCCFGKSMVTKFALQGRSFVFKSSQFGSTNEFQCSKMAPDEDELERRAREEDKICLPEGYREPDLLETLPRPRNVIGLSSICQELAKRDRSPVQLRPALTPPLPAPRIAMHQPGFENLTSAEKLNDRDYRGLLYKAYPNEATCACLTAEDHARVLTETRLAWSAPTEEHRGSGPSASCYTENCGSGGPGSEPGGKKGCFGGPRLRGGGCVDGCGAGPYTEQSNGKLGYRRYDRTNSGMARANSVIAYPGATSAEKSESDVDCLLRAFKNTQEFVDSIGKVPGLAGLGLTDPSESPYFGRERESSRYTRPRNESPGSAATPRSSNAANPSDYSQGDTQMPLGARTAGARFGVTPSTKSVAPFLTGGPVPTTRRTADPALPDEFAEGRGAGENNDRSQDFERESQAPVESERTPCVEPRCNFRRKKVLQKSSPRRGQLRLSAPKKPSVPRKLAKFNERVKASGRPRTFSDGLETGIGNRKRQMRFARSSLGPGGDRIVNTKPHVRVSRRIMNFVYTAGTQYPGITYGHKNCLDPRIRVPANMGWLWNSSNVVGKLKPRLGWKPGAISRIVNEQLKEAKAGVTESRGTSSSSLAKKRKLAKSKSSTVLRKNLRTRTKEKDDEETEFPPTLHIHRKDGTYYVTMYPVKPDTTDVPQLQEPMKPLQFKITKNRDDVSATSSSTASDMEIEFSPPAAVNRYRKKPNVVHVDTQVKQQQIIDAFKPTDVKKTKKTKEGTKSGKKEKKK